MNKKEKFYKNLSQFNIQEKPKVEKVEFKNVKTLEKLEGQLQSIMSKLDDSKIKSEISNYNKLNQEHIQSQKTYDQVEVVFDDIAARLAKLVKEKDKKGKELVKAGKDEDKKRDKKETAAQKVFRANDKYIADYKKGTAIQDKLVQAIFDVEEAAKQLGVTISVSKYEALVERFDNTTKDPLSKLDFDY